jgi:hypothetical protein
MNDTISNRRKISLGFTDESVDEGQHICYLYNDDCERRRIMAKYLESGLLAHEKVLYLVDLMTPDEMLVSLEELGVDVRSKMADLTVAEAASVYCPRGQFDPEEMLGIARAFYQKAVNEQGYAGMRGTGEMSWCLVEGRVNETSLMEYEARLNQLIAECPLNACCQYDVRRFDGNTIMDVLAVHPAMIVRGQLVRNPYYIQPEVFLKELYARKKGPGK